MFTRRKKSYGVIIGTSIVITLCILIVVIAWPTESGTTQDPNSLYGSGGDVIEPDNNKPAGGIDNHSQENNEGKNNNPSTPGNTEGENEGTPKPKENSQPTGISANTESYYLVKYVDGYVRVFFFDGNGNTLELEKTGVAYDVLNPSDQKLLSNGIKASSQEELATILQDFEG